MSKRVARRRKKQGLKQQKTGRRKLIIAVCLPLCLLLAAITIARWPTLPGINKPPAAPPPGNFNANSPSKEYIYAGGRLIATEVPASSAAPAGLMATTRDGSLVIDISWNPAQGAQSYRLERSAGNGASYQPVSSTVSTTSFSDTTMTEGLAYLYRVCVADSQGNCLSAYSNVDLAAAVVFSDDPLGDPLTGPGTTIQARHITQLRAAINAVRSAAGLPDAVWDNTHPVAAQQWIYASHITEMRARLDEARNALNTCCGVSLPGTYTEPNLAGGNLFGIRRAHIKDLRDRVK